LAGRRAGDGFDQNHGSTQAARQAGKCRCPPEKIWRALTQPHLIAKQGWPQFLAELEQVLARVD
jgi:hypothetical protein